MQRQGNSIQIAKPRDAAVEVDVGGVIAGLVDKAWGDAK